MICISLGSISFEDCIKALYTSEYTEIRMDLLNYSDEQFIQIFSVKRNTLATFRPGKLSDKERIEKLKMAISAGSGFVDVEFEASIEYKKELIDFAHKYGSKVIVSYHDYDKTPAHAELIDIINQSFQCGADYVKLATMAQEEEDNSRLLGLYEHYKGLIAFCMGTKGVISRVVAPFLGSMFTYAALNEELAVAPGQLTVNQLNDIYNILNNKRKN